MKLLLLLALLGFANADSPCCPGCSCELSSFDDDTLAVFDFAADQIAQGEGLTGQQVTPVSVSVQVVAGKIYTLDMMIGGQEFTTKVFMDFNGNMSLTNGWLVVNPAPTQPVILGQCQCPDGSMGQSVNPTELSTDPNSMVINGCKCTNNRPLLGQCTCPNGKNGMAVAYDQDTDGTVDGCLCEQPKPLLGQCSCPDGSSGQLVSLDADTDGVKDGCQCAVKPTLLGACECSDGTQGMMVSGGGCSCGNQGHLTPPGHTHGGWSANVVSPAAQNAADFAFGELTTSDPDLLGASDPTALTLTEVMNVHTQVVAGTNYKMDLVITDGSNTWTYNVVVYEDLTGTMTLTSSDLASSTASSTHAATNSAWTAMMGVGPVIITPNMPAYAAQNNESQGNTGNQDLWTNTVDTMIFSNSAGMMMGGTSAGTLGGDNQATTSTFGGFSEACTTPALCADNADVVAAATAGTTQLQGQVNTVIEECKPVYAQQQVVAGINYKIIIECSSFGQTVFFRTDVYMDVTQQYTLNNSAEVHAPTNGQWSSVLQQP